MYRDRASKTRDYRRMKHYWKYNYRVKSPKRFGLHKPPTGFRGCGVCCRFDVHERDDYSYIRHALKKQLREELYNA